MGFVAFLVVVGIVIGAVIVFGKGEKGKKKPSSAISAKEQMFLTTALGDVEKEKKQKAEAEKVICTFCESYVDIGENETCPNCGASLKEAIEEKKRKDQTVSMEFLKVQAETEKDRAQRERTDKVIDMMGAAVISSVVPGAGRTIQRARRNARKRR